MRASPCGCCARFEDLFGQTGFAGGGLRGGSWALRPHGYELHGMLDVPGVALSDSIRIAGDATSQLQIIGHLTVGGRLAGGLTLRGFTLGGGVGGAQVHARLTAL
jgi:hypothetical protein